MKVILKTAHTHDGTEHAAGAHIEVSEQDAAFLREHGVIDDLAPAKAGAKTNEVKA